MTIDDIHLSEPKIVELEEDELKIGLAFENEEIAAKSIQLWSEKTFCPLAKVCNCLDIYHHHQQ